MGAPCGAGGSGTAARLRPATCRPRSRRLSGAPAFSTRGRTRAEPPCAAGPLGQRWQAAGGTNCARLRHLSLKRTMSVSFRPLVAVLSTRSTLGRFYTQSPWRQNGGKRRLSVEGDRAMPAWGPRPSPLCRAGRPHPRVCLFPLAFAPEAV